MASETSKPSPKKSLSGKVAKVLSTSRVVINKGARDGVTSNDKFVIFEFGDEVQDPDTQENLGRLQVVKGRAEVIGLQDRIAVLEGVAYEYPQGLNIYSSAFSGQYPRRTVVPLEGVKIGDSALRYD